ncbi:obscurin-like isoform X3 [Brienomyrus brachyistius]|uniref:obscurin-like isoform X3 n=1 Tax=Brienomyrus brachyistius TaxID=42636 RepID=UPI0020B1ED56|nr:obscurin-like isoform X3 [Brienomyrus brachyistius]
MDVFGGAPRFLAYPRPVVVQSGTDAALKCQIGGDPRPAVIWERNNKQIHPEGRYRLFEDGNVYNLIISGASMEDSGQYICKAKNSIGETYAAATLKVEGEAQELELREENKPRFLIKPLSTRVGRGEDAVFSCKLWGNPRPEVVWEKDGKKLTEIFESTHFSVGYQDGGWFQLKIFKTRAPDGGVYTCKARNEFGEGLAGAVLLVDAGPGHEEEGTRNGYANGHWKPHQSKQRGGRQVATRVKEDPLPSSAKVKMFAVTEGKHAKFRCFVTGKPKPEIIWRKDGRLILSGRRYLLYEDREGYFTLKVLYCKQQDNGVYVCAASNTAGQTLSAVHLSVKEPLVRFKQPLTDLEVWERDLAILECEVPEDTVPTTWYLEDRRLQPGAKYGMEEWGTKRRLTIRDIGADDDGIYLCEMADGGRSIAEVSVRGTIVRKLPRKVDVLEGENAAFCVEVEEEEMDIHWYKEGVELRETHQTILKSFGKTHILVFVNTSPQDSGTVTFIVGRSKTSSHLRVKSVRHSPPSCPINVQINLERANAALLSWVPAHDSRRNPPSGYVLERQEVGSQEWLQCLTTDSATSVEILGDSVPCEADYRFRICSVNKYGKSGHVDFPRAAHLVPVAKIQAPLQDALVPEGQDASFTIDLSASVIGTWFLNGTQIQDDDRFLMRRSRTHHSLRIRGVQEADNGAEITFIAYGVRDSAALYIQAPLVKFKILSEMDRNKFIEVGNPIVLYCELSDPQAPVHWYKNGMELHTSDTLHIQSEGTMRRIVIPSAEFSHSGVYSCDAIDDVIRFNVEVEAPPVRFFSIPEVERNKSFEAGQPIVLQCELSDTTAQVCWYKDGIELHSKTGIDIQSDGSMRTLIVQSADFIHSGVYTCKTKGDAIKFIVDIKAPLLRFTALSETEKNKSIEAGCPIVLQCELSDPTAQVCWYKDGSELHPHSGTDIQSEGSVRTLTVQSAELLHSGLYSCQTKDDSVQFHVDIKESPPVALPLRFSAVPEVKKPKSVEPGCPIVLQHELSHPNAQVCGYEDGKELHPRAGIDNQTNGITRTVVVQTSEFSNSGTNNCETKDDAIQFNLDLQEKNKSIEAGQPIVLQCERSDPTAQVCWYTDGTQPLPKADLDIQSEGTTRTLSVQSAELSHTGMYSCKTTDDDLHFNVEVAEKLPHSGECSCEISDDAVQSTVDNKAPPVTFSTIPEAEGQLKSIEAGNPIVLHCELSNPTAQVCWYKDGKQLHPQAGLEIQSVGSVRRLIIESASFFHSGVYSCDTADDVITFKVDVEASSERFPAVPEVEKSKPIETDSPIMWQCQPSAPRRQTQKDETKCSPRPELDIQSEDSMRRLAAQSELCHSQEYSCEVDDDLLTLKVDVKAPSTKFKVVPELERCSSVNVGCPIVLHCEVSDPTAQVSWYKNVTELLSKPGQDIKSEGITRQLIIQSAELSHTGLYSCETVDDAVQFNVNVKESIVPTLRFSAIPELEKNKSIEAGQPIDLQCELSDSSAQVCWYKDGIELQPKTEIDIQSDDNMRRLVIQSADFIHSGVYSCKTEGDAVEFNVDVKAPPVRFKDLSEAEKIKSIEAGCPIVLHCEISDPTAQVWWYKDGIELHPQVGIDIQSDGNIKKLTVQSAEISHTGLYICAAVEDDITFKVVVQAPPVKFSDVPEAQRHKYVKPGCPVILQCEVSDPSAQVQWYKDGIELHPKTGMNFQLEENTRKLTIDSAETSHSGVYKCVALDDVITFKVDVQAPPVKFSDVPEAQRHKCVKQGCPIILQCEISDSTAKVWWYKDGMQLHPKLGIDIQSNGNIRKLTVQSAEISHSGVYSCGAVDDAIAFKVDVQAPPVKFSDVPEAQRHKSVKPGCPIILQCEVSDPSAQVCWSKDGIELHPKTGINIQSEGTMRTLIIQSADICHSGVYSCNTMDDIIQFYVDIKASTAIFSPIPESEKSKSIEAGYPTEAQCELSDPNSQVWKTDGTELHPQTGINGQIEDIPQTMPVPLAEIAKAGLNSCKTTDNILKFTVDNEAPSVKFVELPEVERHESVEAGQPIVLPCELSDPSAQVWYKDGTELPKLGINIQSEANIRTQVIQSADFCHSGIYSCITGDDATQFYVDSKALPGRLASIPEVEMNKSIEPGCPIVLQCELSDPTAEVSWYKDGIELSPQVGIDMLSHGNSRTLSVRSAELCHTGVYSCKTKDNVIHFNVDIKAESPRFIELPEAERNKCVKAGSPITLQCVLTDPSAHVCWSKDGIELIPNKETCIQSDGTMRGVVIQSAELCHSGIYSCALADDVMTFMVDVQAPPVKFSAVPEVERYKSVEAGQPIVLQCELSDPTAQVKWYKDGIELSSQNGTDIQSDGSVRRLVIQSAQLSHSGEFSCDAVDDVIAFEVKVEGLAPGSVCVEFACSQAILVPSHIQRTCGLAPPVRFSAVPEVEKNKSIEAGQPIVLQCELSDHTSQVCWYKDGIQLHPKTGIDFKSEGTMRTLIIQSADLSGVYSCKTADDISEFYVDVKAPLVTFVEMPEENLQKNVVELDPLVLHCELSRPDAATQWYKDGVEIKPGNNTIMKADGIQRQLIIQTTHLSDSGTYTCRAGDNTLLFKVSIREPPVMIVYPKEDVHLDRYVSEEIVLSCELSRQNGTVNWYKDGQKLQESENIKIKSEGPYRRLKILHGTTEDSGEYVCDTADDSIFFQLNITEAPVRIISPSQSQMELCQQTSERVVLSCELSRANAPVRWYRDGLEVEENDNLILEVDGIYRRLIIPETTVQDSAEYVCDTVDDSVTFFVNIAEPPVRFVRPRKMCSTVEIVVGDPVVLECEVSRASAQVSWKKDGEEMEESRNITIIEDGISRQLTIRSSSLKDSGQYICDAKDDVMDFTVKICEKPVKILSKSNRTEQQFETSEDIVLECELSRANGIAKWYKDGENIVENEHFYFEEEGTFRSLVIMNAELTDSGKYVCDVRDDKIVFHVTVKEPPVTILGNSGSPEHHSLLAGDDLILECEVSRASATVDWYCDGKLLSSDSRIHIESYGTVRKLVLSRLQPSDSGTYTCDAIDDKMSTIVKVQETPLRFLDKPESNIITAYEKESVTFTVKVSQDNATLQWLKELKQLTGDRIHTGSERNTHFLTIKNLQRSDSGRYTCDASTDQMQFNLTVKAFRVTFVRPLENAVAQKDGLITLQCELNETKGDVLWLKDGQEITPSFRLAIRAEGRVRTLTIRNISERDAGQYTCESKDDRTSARIIVETPRVVEFIAELYNTTVLEGEDATFKCMVSPEDIQVVWYRDGQPITPDERFTVSSNGLCHTLHIHNCQVSDSCRITAMAEGLKSEASLKVQETQVLFTKKMESVKSEEYAEATFVVEVNMEAGEVQWMRQGVVIQSGPKFTLKQVGRKRSLTIHKLSLSDQGTYRCETLHDCTRGELAVEPRKVTIRKRLTQMETFERETASFEVELSHPNVEGVWQKDGVRLKPSNYCRISTKGCVHGLTLLNLSMEDTGTITFSAGNVGTFARLVVKELPVTIVKKMEDLRLPEGSMASLECELSKQNADVKWLKNGIVVKPDKNHRIYSMGRKRFLQILKCDQSDTGIYTCDAGDTTASCSLDIYERQVEVVHGLEDLDIQEDQNAVFVCEVSVADVPGEWYKNGEEIRPSSTIKIRQEGTKHFLLICNVKAEDSGEIKFVAKQAESIAYLEVEALPMTIVNPLRDITVEEKSRVVLDCTVSNPRSSIRWYHGNNVVLPSEHFEICSEGCYRKLVIQQVSLEDGGVYSVQVGEHVSSARLTVKACTSD